jgi:NADH-quinone oxidoreductase subunit L
MMAIWLIWLTIGLPWFGALAVWLVGHKWPGPRRPQAQHVLAVATSVLAGVTAVALLPLATDAVVINVPFGDPFGALTFIPDGLGIFLAIVATVIGSLAVIFSVAYMGDHPQLGRYYILVLLFIGAMAALVLTGSLFFLFIFWEVTALCSYALISFDNDNPAAIAGGIKALIITQFGGLGLLALALMAYATTGSLQINHFLAAAPDLPPMILGLMAFGALAAAAAKSAQVPFHTWLPDAMEAPTPISALIHAATMVNAGIYLLARLFPAFADVAGWQTAVALVGLLSALLAALMALTANDLKRVLAYSTISQLGYMVAAIGSGSVFASQFHLFSHAIFKALLFLAAGAVIHVTGTRDLRRMGGLGRTMPFVRSVFLVGALALAGLPPLNGFWSKELVLESALAGSDWWLFTGLLLGAGLTAAYTLRLTWLVFYAESRRTQESHDTPIAMRLPLALLAFGTTVSWLLAGPFGALLSETLPAHTHVLHTPSTTDLILAILAAPATYLALLVITTGMLTWWYRARLAGLTQRLEWFAWLADAAASGFGFEHVNQWIVTGTQQAATQLQRAQTGQLNWNVVGLISALVMLLLILWWSL